MAGAMSCGVSPGECWSPGCLARPGPQVCMPLASRLLDLAGLRDLVSHREAVRASGCETPASAEFPACAPRRVRSLRRATNRQGWAPPGSAAGHLSQCVIR